MSTKPACRRPPAFVLAAIALLSLLTVNTARAETFSGFHIDLGEVGRFYDTLYRDRVTGERTDSLVVYNWKSIPFGNQRYRVATFLETDVDSTREVVDYTVLPGYETRFTVPRTAFFERTSLDVGELTVEQPRDFSIPGLRVDLTSTEAMIARIEARSRDQVWRESARAVVTSLQAQATSSTGGIRFDIPVPMPKSLESIFGPGEKTNITIKGREEITLSGETTVIKPFLGVEGREKQSLFPALDMQQKLDVSLTGTIGDKVSIQVDHSSEAVGSDANRVRLAYTGYEDEVIQLIELGNTSLSLPGSQLVSFSASAQGLFGVKVLAKTGSTDLTFIASKQEGELSNSTFSPTGGSLGQTETSAIRDVDYVKNKYFYFNDPRITPGSLYPDGDKVIEVYRTVTANDLIINPTINRRAGWAIADPDGTGDGLQAAADSIAAGGSPVASIQQDFELLQKDIDYFYITDVNTNPPVVVGIELAEAVPNTALKSIGVIYTAQDGRAIGGTYATYGLPPDPDPKKGDMLMLEMLKAPEPDPNGLFPSTWQLMIRNIYNLGLTNIDGNTLDVSIEDILDTRINPSIPDSATVPYLRIFGLDRTDRSGSGGPDNRIDLTSGLVHLDTGILQFPTLEPFTPPASLVTEWTDTSFAFIGRYQAQYDKSARIYAEKLNPTTEQEVSQYVIKVTAVSTSKTFRINALDIVENSEVITLNNDRLSRGTDYEIDYTTGEVTLKEPVLARLTPDARINVEYEFKPLGGGGSSTLAGMSTTSKLGDNLRIGTTALYESKSTSSDRPRLGEEPTRAIVGGITANYQHESRFLTDLANLLPYVDSDAPSTITLDGEIAASLPNPNTKHEAYIDDFEGVEDTDRIGLSRRSWYMASLPVDGGVVKPDTARLKFVWYNIEPDSGGVHRRDLNPSLDEKESTLVQTLDIEMSEMPAPGDTASYAGVMLGIPGGGLDLSQGQFIEIWVNDFKPDPLMRGGKLHIDLGVIDENFFHPEDNDATTNFNDEDQNRDGFAAAFDDTGLDGKFNDEGEPSLPGGSSEDPSGDDIVIGRINGRLSKVNGTEGNLLYDTEDLDRNGQLSRENAYFSYVIDLADSADIDIRRQYPGYSGFRDKHHNDAWRLYRIKLTNRTVAATGSLQPRLDEIRHVRIWFDDVNKVVRDDDARGRRRIQIAEFGIQGNRWEADGVRNLSDGLRTNPTTEFALGVVSTKTDPGFYHPPVTPHQLNGVFDKESSLALRYSDLPEGAAVRILKRFLGQGLNLTLYRDLNFWVHTDSIRPGVEYYFRMGSNENTYYEVTVPFTREYYNATGWSRVVVKLADLTNLKFEPADSVVYGTAADAAEPGRSYPVRMRGQPNLTGVRFLYAGVRNVSSTRSHDGEIWINDIFTGDVIRDADHAERVNANVSLAGGALSLGASWSRAGADYRGLRQTRGSGADASTYGLGAKTDLQYFLPLGGFSIPVSGNYGVAKSLPKFPPNSDTEILDQSVADSLRTERKTRSFSASISKRTASNNVLMRYTLDRIRPNFAYSDQRGISPSSHDTSTTMSGSVGYQLNWSGDKTFKLFGKNRMRWWINQIDFSSSANRQTATRWSLVGGKFQRDPYQYNASLRNQGSVRYAPFRSLDATFNGFVLRDVGLEHEWMGVNVGTEVGRGEQLRTSFVPPPSWPVVRLFEPSIEVQSDYGEDSGPNVRRQGDPRGTRNVHASRNDTGKMRFEVGKHLGGLFKRFGWEPGAKKGANPAPTGSAPPGGAGTPEPPPSAPPDSTATTRPRPGVGHLFNKFGEILVALRPVGFNIQHRESSNYGRIPDRPDLSYQFGLRTETGLVVNGKPIENPDQRNENLSFKLDSGVQLSQRFDLQGRYSRATSDTDFRANKSRTVNTTWPDVQANWDGLAEFRPLRPILKTAQLNMSYRETHQESGQRDQEPVTTNDTFTLSPGLVMTWKNDLNSTLTVAYSRNSSETRGSGSTNTNLAVNVDFKRTFRGGGGLNFFGKKMKWNNELESDLVLSYSKIAGERTTPGGLSEPIPATTSWRVAPTARYFFSRNINGSAFIDFSHTYAEQTDQTTTAIRLGVSALVNF